MAVPRPDCGPPGNDPRLQRYSREIRMANTRGPIERPLSPHLQIYRLTLTMAMSIAHRVTGAALYLGALLLVWWLVAAATSARQYDVVNAVFSSWLRRIVLFGYTSALMHHMLGGMRPLL